MGLEPNQPGFVEELCIALAHRWEPERLFVIFTAHMDEAASHGHDPILTMGAILGNAYDWRKFERDLQHIQDRYGFTIFHAKDFKNRKGEFKHWPYEKYSGLINDLTALIRDTMKEGVTITLPHTRYMAEYRAPPIPKGMPLDSHYGVCFRACLAHLSGIIGQVGSGNHTLHIVIEDGHKNVGDCIRIFDEAKELYRANGRNILGTITVAKKTDPTARPLMIADFLAHTHYMLDANARKGEPSYAKVTVAVPIRKYEAGLTMLELHGDALHDLKRHWERRKRERHEAAQAAYAARRASR